MLMERVRAVLHASGLPHFLWGEAVRHVFWLKNRTSMKALPNKTPFEAATDRKPDLSPVRKWGSVVWVHDPTGSKLDPRAREGRWMGVDEQSKGARMYWPSRRTVSIERNLYYSPPQSSQLKGEEGHHSPVREFDDFELLPTSAAQPSAQPTLVPTTQPPPLKVLTPSVPVSVVTRQSRRTHMPSRAVCEVIEGRAKGFVPGGFPELSGDVSHERTYQEKEKERTVDEKDDAEVEATVSALEADEDLLEYALAAEVSEAEALEPRTLAEARTRSDWPLWEKAIQEELDTLHKAGTWSLEEAPPGVNVVGSKWVFKAKKDAAGKVVRYKAHLVTQGFSSPRCRLFRHIRTCREVAIDSGYSGNRESSEHGVTPS
jgi:Reverse transcriptase (RNA-dependent DNA polymerase)